MQIHNGYIYFLPQVTAEQKAVLPAQQQALCNKLFRMKPGNTQKELLAENATGYLVLEDGSVYYASGGEIFPVNEGSVSLSVKSITGYLSGITACIWWILQEM